MAGDRDAADPWWVFRPVARDWRCAPASPEPTRFHRRLPGYRPTPLVEMPGLAAELGVGRVFVKDESARFGLPAFKILGTSWAIHRAVSGDGHDPGIRVLVTATDGNHGRAVARTARMHGLRAVVFVPRGVHPAAVTAIAGEDAEVRPVDGAYDDAVRAAASAAEAPGHLLVQDTAVPGHPDLVTTIVAGYATLFHEIDDQLSAVSAPLPGLVAVPVGVGSLAQAAVTHYRAAGRPTAAALLAVEPVAAACLLASLRAGRLTTISTKDTSMAGLNCGTPSAAAWPHLRDGLDAAVAVTDVDSRLAAAELATGGVSAGPCGAAALAGVRAALTGVRRESLGVGPESTVVLLCTEGTAANPAWATPVWATSA